MIRFRAVLTQMLLNLAIFLCASSLHANSGQADSVTADGALVDSSASQDWQTTVRTVKTHFIASGYQELAHSLAQLSEGVMAFCESPNDQGYQQAQLLWRRSMLNWMAVSWVHFGPISVATERFDIQIWPIRKGITHKTIKRLLARGDQLTVKEVQDAGVSVRGLTGSEYLLFSNSGGLLSHYQASDQQASQSMMAKARCMILQQAVEQSLNTAVSLSERWAVESDLAPFKAGVDVLDVNDPIASSASVIWNALLAEIEFIALRKLEGPINPYGTKAKPTGVEVWRAQYSIQNIKRQIGVLKRLYNDGFASQIADSMLNKQVMMGFNQILASLEAFDTSLFEALKTEQGRDQAKALNALVNELYRLLREEVTPKTGFTLGFNGNDGD